MVDDDYKRGLAVNQVIARDRLAAQLGLRAEVSLADGLVSINLQAASGRLPEIVLVSLIHPTRAGEDQVLKLAGHNGTYGGALAQMAPGPLADFNRRRIPQLANERGPQISCRDHDKD